MEAFFVETTRLRDAFGDSDDREHQDWDECIVNEERLVVDGIVRPPFDWEDLVSFSDERAAAYG